MKARIDRVDLPTATRKSYILTVTDEGSKQHKVYAYPDRASEPFEVGIEAEFACESKTGNDGTEYFVLKQWGEPKAPPPKQGGGFKGGGNWQPKSREEINASNIAGLGKSCLESMTIKQEDKLAMFAAFCAQYWIEVEKVKP